MKCDFLKTSARSNTKRQLGTFNFGKSTQYICSTFKGQIIQPTETNIILILLPSLWSEYFFSAIRFEKAACTGYGLTCTRKISSSCLFLTVMKIPEEPNAKSNNNLCSSFLNPVICHSWFWVWKCKVLKFKELKWIIKLYRMSLDVLRLRSTYLIPYFSILK